MGGRGSCYRRCFGGRVYEAVGPTKGPHLAPCLACNGTGRVSVYRTRNLGNGGRGLITGLELGYGFTVKVAGTDVTGAYPVPACASFVSVPGAVGIATISTATEPPVGMVPNVQSKRLPP
jgi:hypothetical protein